MAKRFTIEEDTMGFTPDTWEFDTEHDARKAIFEMCAEYRKNVGMYDKMKYLSDLLNIDSVSFRYSERWIITDTATLEQQTVYINQEYFSDGRNIVETSAVPKFWNYRR